MGLLPNLFLSLSMAFGGIGQVAAQPEVSPDTPQHGYKNFITALKSLCQTNRHILLGDSDHGSLEIMQLTADPRVLQAIKSCGSTLVLERETAQNEGYQPSQFPQDPEKEAASIRTVQSYLYKQGKLTYPVTGEWNETTPLVLYVFISKLQQAARLPEDGFYTEDVKKLIRKNNPGADKFIEALDYLKDQRVLKARPTLATLYQDIQFSALDSLSPLAADAKYDDKVSWLQFAEIWHAAKLNLPIVYPDYRQARVQGDPQVQEMWKRIIAGEADKSDAGTVYAQIRVNAELARDPKLRAAYLTLNRLVEESATPDSNRIIANNALRLLNGAPSVFKFGAGHMMMENDLNEMLPNSVTILLKATPDQRMSCSLTKKFGDTCKNAPQYVYDIQSDAMIKVEKGSVTEQAYTGMLRYHLTREEYDTAVRKIPADLRPHVLPYSEFDADPKNNVLPPNWMQSKKVYTFK